VIQSTLLEYQLPPVACEVCRLLFLKKKKQQKKNRELEQIQQHHDFDINNHLRRLNPLVGLVLNPNWK
jgi:hypothetical protein